jgi:hypothetical protein
MSQRVILLVAVLATSFARDPRAAGPALDKTTFAAVKNDLQAGQFAHAVSLLEPFTSPPDAMPVPLYLLGLVRLQEGKLDDAQVVVDRLRAHGTSEGAAYIDKLAPLLQTARTNAAVRVEFVAALKNLDGDGAGAALRRMDLPAEQRAAVGIYLDAFRGRLATAILRLNGPDMQRLPADALAKLRAELTTSTGQFRDLSEQLRWYGDSSLAAASCQPADARERSVKSGLVLAEYVRLTQLALQLFPLNDRFMDAAFLGALLSAPYDDVASLGDTILRAKGTLRIPFYSASSRFTLVIDDRSRRISTELDSDTPANVNGSEQLGTHVLFDLSFAEVTGIHQRARNVVSSGSLASDSYALKLDPRGQAPHYLFMSLVHCLYGEETQKQVTRNLGLFIQHAIARERRVAAELVDPSKVTRDRLQIFSEIVGTSTVTAANFAEQMRQSAQQRGQQAPNDGRMSLSETLGQTAQEGQTLMTRRADLLKAQAALRDAQRDSSRSWSESLADSVLARQMTVIAGRVDQLVSLIEIK